MAEQGYTPDAIGPFHKVMVPYLLELLRIGRDEVVVDVGAAQGHAAISAKVAGYQRVVVVDIDPFNYPLFRQRYAIRGELCDVSREALPFGDAQVGALICFHLIEHLYAAGTFLSETRRVLRTDGALILVTPDWRKQYRTFWRDPTHTHPYDKESIARLLRMYSFSKTWVSSWGPRYGAGRLQAYRWLPKLGMIGADLLAVAVK
jgi:ubiquinone/menaquinone biosynthesis C-methylase UbiE